MATVPEQIVVTSLADEIAFRVESAILEGVYPPGSRLIQDELCERFGVSRTPVREALRKLQARNLVLVIPNRGATVRLPTRKELSDVYDVRSELEGYACELAAPRATDVTFEGLDEAQRRIVHLVERLIKGNMDDGELAGVHVQLNRANDDFHGLVHLTAGNDRLRQMIGDLGRVFPKDYFWRGIRTEDEMVALNLTEHDRIRSSMSAGEPRAARRAMREHIDHARSVLLTYLDEQGFWK